MKWESIPREKGLTGSFGPVEVRDHYMCIVENGGQEYKQGVQVSSYNHNPSKSLLQGGSGNVDLFMMFGLVSNKI